MSNKLIKPDELETIFTAGAAWMTETTMDRLHHHVKTLTAERDRLREAIAPIVVEMSQAISNGSPNTSGTTAFRVDVYVVSNWRAVLSAALAAKEPRDE